MKPYNPQKFVPDMCKIAYNLTLKRLGHFVGVLGDLKTPKGHFEIKDL